MVDVQSQNQLREGSIALAADVSGLDSSDFVFVIAPTEMATLTTPADATGPSNFHPTTVSRLLANVRVEAIG